MGLLVLLVILVLVFGGGGFHLSRSGNSEFGGLLYILCVIVVILFVLHLLGIY